MTPVSDDTLIHLPYGDTTLAFRLPRRSLLGIMTPAEVSAAADPAVLVREALRHPIGRPPLRELVRAGQHIVIIVDDMTRPTPQQVLLPPLLQELEDAGGGLHTEILIATGTHRAMTPAEIERKVGRQVMDAYPVVNHDAMDQNNLAHLGITPNGTPIVVNRRVVEADLVIAVGNVVPHCLAGWSGGAKIIQPGVCGEETTHHTHALNMYSPVPHLGRLDNPVRQEIEAIVQRVRLDFMVNTVLNARAEVVHVVAGDPYHSHRKAVELAAPIWVQPVPIMPDIVVISSHPADLDYWQGVKALYAAELVVKRGGDIILVSPCWEGISTNLHHLEAMRLAQGLPSKAIRHEAVQRGFTDWTGLNTATVTARVNELAYVQMVTSGLTDEDLAIIGHARAESIEAGLERALARQGKDARVLVITHGGDLCPVLRPA